MDLSINEGTLVVTGGLGDSVQTAIVIKKTPKGFSAAGAEDLLMSQRYGKRGADWTIQHQESIQRDGRTYDIYTIVLANGVEKMLYFDVSDWLARAQHYTR